MIKSNLVDAFALGDIVCAFLTTGRFAGSHIGRLVVRATGVFEMITSIGKITPVRHNSCQLVHRIDGYSYVV